MLRMWINQPSTLQPLHKLHGERVLAINENGSWRVYFLRGNVVSMMVPDNTLSGGWNEEMRPPEAAR